MDTDYPVYNRTIEDVKSIIKHAKLDEKHLTQVTQTLYFPNNLNETSNLRLLELNPDLLRHLEEGKSLCFKGGLNDKVVLCSDDKTYEVKEAEISNSLLLVPNLKFAQSTSTSPLKSPKNSNNQNNSLDSSVEDDESLDLPRILEKRNVVKIFHEYYECREVKPRYRKLYDLLQVTRYSGPENEYCIDSGLLFTFEQLLNTIQCSEKEFHVGLELYRAFEFDGKMRMLQYEYEYRVITLMLGLINENSWGLHEIEKETTIQLLKDIIPIEIVENLFEFYTEPSVENNGKYTYKPDMVCRIVAQNILQQGLKFHIDEFFVTWLEALPEHFDADEKYLRGIGVIDRDSKPQCVRALSEINLPVNITERLRILFKTKPKWTLEEIEPYIECFSTHELPVTGILVKYTRSMYVNGKRLYLTKH